MIELDYPLSTKARKAKRIIQLAVESFFLAIFSTIILGFIIGFRPVYIIGWSMEDQIMKGDVVIIKPVDEKYLNVGDVVTFPKGKSVKTTHKIFKIENGIVFTGGYIADEPTEQTPVEQLAGKVIYICPFLGDTIEWLKSRENIVNLILLITGVAMVLIFFKNKTYYVFD